MPVLINKDVALMEVGKHENEWSMAKIPVRKVPKEGSHHRQSRELVLAISSMVYSIGHTPHPVVVVRKGIREVGI